MNTPGIGFFKFFFFFFFFFFTSDNFCDFYLCSCTPTPSEKYTLKGKNVISKGANSFL